MHNLKSQYSSNLLQITNSFLLKLKPNEISDEDSYPYILGANYDDIKICLEKITNALPPDVLINNGSRISRDIKREIVTNLILFMVQEDITTESFDQKFFKFYIRYYNRNLR